MQVTDVIKGDFEHSELELVGDRGADCREYADSRKYEIGKEFLFVIPSEDRVQELAGCGESSILVNNNIVEGFRRTSEGYEPYSMSLKATIEQMKIEEVKHEKYK